MHVSAVGGLRIIKICFVGTSLQVFCTTLLVIASSLPWLTNAQVMSSAPYLHSWLHLLLSGPPKQRGGGCFMSKGDPGTLERESGASSRVMMKDWQ